MKSIFSPIITPLKSDLEKIMALKGKETKDLRRALRRARMVTKELTVYYVGHGSADFVNGNTYLLTSDYVPSLPSTALNLLSLFENLKKHRSSYNFTSINAVLNINYLPPQRSGTRLELQFTSYISAISTPGLSVFFSTSAGQKILFSAAKHNSIFSEYLSLGSRELQTLIRMGKLPLSNCFVFYPTISQVFLQGRFLK
jgi:hypothetical protein